MHPGHQIVKKGTNVGDTWVIKRLDVRVRKCCLTQELWVEYWEMMHQRRSEIDVQISAEGLNYFSLGHHMWNK